MNNCDPLIVSGIPIDQETKVGFFGSTDQALQQQGFQLSTPPCSCPACRPFLKIPKKDNHGQL